MTAGPGCAVPMYVHPVLAPQAWQRLAEGDLGGGFVVVNAADGPGTAVDPAYTEVLAALSAAGVPVVGYVDAGYGRREVASVVEDAGRWRRLYGVRDVFLDRVPSGVELAHRVREADGRLRGAGAERVVLNPGVVPAPEICRIGDVVVTFEGSWADHLAHRPPAWLREHRPERLCHLVHGIPAEVGPEAVARRALAAGAAVVGASRGPLPNPWDRSWFGPWPSATTGQISA